MVNSPGRLSWKGDIQFGKKSKIMEKTTLTLTIHFIVSQLLYPHFPGVGASPLSQKEVTGYRV